MFVIKLIFIILSFFQQYYPYQYNQQNKNIMIVAHPDDESIFGGDHILHEHYFIICLTNGNNETRRKEFEEMLKKTNNDGIILNYPDSIDGKRVKWDNTDEISKQIETYLMKNDFDKIVTHNPKGEYGHIHHKLTNKIVTDLCISHHLTDKLYYFGNYYSKHNMPHINLPQLKNENLKRKKELISIYKSQTKARNKLQHSYPFEQWIKYQ